MIVVGSTVRHRRHPDEVGTVRELVEPRPGWRRARVAWPAAEQFVDLEQLELVHPVPASRCSTCGAAVIWVRSATSAAMMILDAAPTPHGTVTINDAGRAVVGADTRTLDLFAPAPVEPAPDVPRYRDHHATCTNPPRRSR